MNRFILCLVLLPFLADAQPSFNMTNLANVDIPNLPIRSGAKYNDCWGYKHANGMEIAIIGGTESIFFYNVTAPAAPVLLFSHQVTNSNGTVNQSLWRDFKTYQHYLYAAADEGTSGLLIFDMSNPNNITLALQTTSFWSRSHNIFIDVPNARLYAAGPNTQLQGLVILSLADPDNPVQLMNLSLTSFGGGYVHDVHVRNNIAYCSHGGLQKLTMYNLSNLGNITVTGSIQDYPGTGYNHSSWVNATGTKLVMADETHGSPLKLVDITNPLDISADDINTFYSELEGAGAPGASIAHNPFILGDLAYIAYYHEGVQVFDISNPEDIELVAYLDTYSNTGYSGYQGVWGVYPYLPSGIIIASDQSTGLYIMQITNQALDIDFLAFAAKRNTEGVQLNWSVADASFGNKFEIKRSDDGGKTFTAVGKVNLLDNESNYAFLDKTADLQRKYVYRIDFLELDGNVVSSPVRSVSSVDGPLAVKINNPVRSMLVVDILKTMEELDLVIYSLDGQLVRSYHLDQPLARIELQTEGLLPGHYMVMANWPGGSEQALVQVIE